MTKYKITFHVDLYAETPDAAFSRAKALVAEVRGIPAEAFEHMPLPTGGVTGAPHTEEGPVGWKCVFAIDEAD